MISGWSRRWGTPQGRILTIFHVSVRGKSTSTSTKSTRSTRGTRSTRSTRSTRPLAEYGSGIRLADCGSEISALECVLVFLVLVVVLVLVS